MYAGYSEFPPPPALRGSIACLWVRRGAGGSVRVLPDACTDIVWRQGAGASVAGPDTTAWFSPAGRGELIAGVRFLPGAGRAAFGVPLVELRDRRASLSELGLDPDELLSGDADPRQAPRVLAKLALRLGGAGPPDRAVQAAVVRLTSPRQRVEPLASELGLSERQLRRRFIAAVGYGPKTLQRVLRLRRFLAASAAGPGELAAAALAAGYADQAHLTRECRDLTGLTPAQLAGTRRF